MFKLFVDNPNRIISIPDTEVYPDGPLVVFPDGILIKGSANTVYLTQSNTLRPFSNYSLFQAMGFKDSDVIKVEDSDLALEPVRQVMQ
jgi:hypothetical protein